MPELPWILRGIDRLVDRHERYVTEMRDTPEFYERLLRYAATRDAAAHEWLAEAMARYDYWQASRFWMFYAIFLFPVAFFSLGFGRYGCGFVLVAMLGIPLLQRFDRWNRRRKARIGLAEGVADIYIKQEVTPPPAGSRIFQSYWSNDAHPRVELDHPMELWDAVARANEWWQFRMPVPRDDGKRITLGISHYDLGLVRRDERGRVELVAGGVVYFSFDPWTNRIQTEGYE